MRGSTDGIGTAAKFNGSWGIVKDSAGNTYVADCDANVIRKIGPSGNVSTFAGSPGASGLTDGTGSAARFNQPHGLAIDKNNILYVADSSNHAIRKITAAGNVTTIAGSAVGGYADGKGAAAKFSNPYGIVVDAAGILYVADTSNHRIRKIDTSYNVTTFIGSSAGFTDGIGSTARFNNPYGIALDTVNNIIYVADWDNARVRKIVMSTLAVTTLAGNGTKAYKDGMAAAASLQAVSLAVGPYNLLYVADANNNRVRGINTQTGQVVTIAGSGAAGKVDSTTLLNATFNNPRGIMAEGKNLYVTNYSGDCSVRMITIDSLTFSGGGRRRSLRKRRQTRSLRKKGSRRSR